MYVNKHAWEHVGQAINHEYQLQYLAHDIPSEHCLKGWYLRNSWKFVALLFSVDAITSCTPQHWPQNSRTHDDWNKISYQS